MAGVFQNIDPPPPSAPGASVPPAFGAGGGHTRWLERGVGGGVNNLEDVRHSSVLYVCKYFMGQSHETALYTPRPFSSSSECRHKCAKRESTQRNRTKEELISVSGIFQKTKRFAVYCIVLV